MKMNRETRRLTRRKGGANGFTLIEIIAAFMILTLGVGSVLAVLSNTVSRERAAVMRTMIADALPFVVELVQVKLADPGELESIPLGPVPSFPSLKWSAKFFPLPDWPGEILGKISITWQEGGDARHEIFVRLFTRIEPFSIRAGKMILLGNEETR